MSIIKKTVKTVALVTAFSCAERFIGFLYRIFLSRSLGAELLGVYQITLSVVGVLVTLTASGIPITVSRLMMKERAANNVKGEKDVVSAGILSSLILSLPITAILFLFRKGFSFIFADSRCYDLLLIILPGVVITSVYAVIRGYFWGNRNFFTYALIEFIEENVMCISGILLVKTAANTWDGALGAAKSVLISYITSFVISTTVFTFKSGRLTNPLLKLKPLIESSSPITAMRTMTSLLGSVVAIIIPARLIKFGIEKSVAIMQFGELSGMAMPLLFIPSTIIGSIALVIVPKLSESFYRKERLVLNSAIERAMQYSLLISALIVPIFIAGGKEIGSVVYANENAGLYLAKSAIIMIPMSLTMITNSILNSLNCEKKTLLNYVLGAIVMLLITWFMTGFIGIHSLIAGYLASYLITGTLNLVLLSKITSNGKFYLKQTLLFTLATAITTIFLYLLHGILTVKFSEFLTLFTICAAGVLFECILIAGMGFFNFKKIFD